MIPQAILTLNVNSGNYGITGEASKEDMRLVFESPGVEKLEKA